MKTSIILPTYNERNNIEKLILELIKINSEFEIIIIDDNSPDGTGKIIDKLKKTYSNIKVIHRKKRLGLSSAIIQGFKVANGNIIGVMDADLSHPTNIINKMINYIEKNKTNFVIGSRLIKGGRVKNWPFSRKIISIIATIMAKLLTNVKDPMSGFFFLKKEVINNIKFTSQGYKICLEILVKGKYDEIIEIPYVFNNRKYGKSKLNVNEYKKYLIDWIKLIRYKIKF